MTKNNTGFEEPLVFSLKGLFEEGFEKHLYKEVERHSYDFCYILIHTEKCITIVNVFKVDNYYINKVDN